MRILLISRGLTGTQTTLHLIPPPLPLGQHEAPTQPPPPPSTRAPRTPLCFYSNSRTRYALVEHQSSLVESLHRDSSALKY